MQPPVKDTTSMIRINIIDSLHRLTQCLRHDMRQQVNSLRIKVPPLINHLFYHQTIYINLLKRWIKFQETPIVLCVLPHVVVYLIYRFQMIDLGITQVL